MKSWSGACEFCFGCSTSPSTEGVPGLGRGFSSSPKGNYSSQGLSGDYRRGLKKLIQGICRNEVASRRPDGTFPSVFQITRSPRLAVVSSSGSRQSGKGPVEPHDLYSRVLCQAGLRTRIVPRAEEHASRNGLPRPKAARRWNLGSPNTRWVEPDRGFAWRIALDRPGCVGSSGGSAS
jgi:hypothetical protein